jgi:hypothetical protein
MQTGAHPSAAWQVTDAAEYIAVPRLRRDRRLGSKQREKFWPAFAAARSASMRAASSPGRASSPP